MDEFLEERILNVFNMFLGPDSMPVDVDRSLSFDCSGHCIRPSVFCISALYECRVYRGTKGLVIYSVA